jgi:hypothetical protein
MNIFNGTCETRGGLRESATSTVNGKIPLWVGVPVSGKVGLGPVDLNNFHLNDNGGEVRELGMRLNLLGNNVSVDDQLGFAGKLLKRAGPRDSSALRQGRQGCEREK